MADALYSLTTNTMFENNGDFDWGEKQRYYQFRFMSNYQDKFNENDAHTHLQHNIEGKR